ncbi:universal stress protein [Chitinophaga sancti]|uniref:universal stress protein n=1 Tax=Chitinophaga sancti TaxID=1004 RepID=UPI002A75B86D|nr:universal stress protein [Chitinophaga sancti]WPQ60454.1 universal stress protein [Chitinophaga sancti]
MRKVVLAFDGTHYSNGAYELVKKIDESEKILLIGVFLPGLRFIPPNYILGGEGIYVPSQVEIDEGKVDELIERFEDDCTRNSIEFRVHKDLSPYSIQKLEKESRFADLMVIGSQPFYENLQGDLADEFFRDILHDSECPVIVAPEEFNYPDHVILAYDGSRSSVFAIKMFAYLFPDLSKGNNTLVYATQKHHNALPDEDYIKELAARHYPDLTLQELELHKLDYFHTWLEDIPNPILVTGAFGRSGFSEIFKRSFCTSEIYKNSYPVFIAHNK